MVAAKRETEREEPMVGEQAEEEPRWRQAGEPIQFTRAELLDTVRKYGVTLSDRQFRSWAEHGLLPVPERRIPPATTDGVVRALYPRWTPILILELDERLTLGEKVSELRDFAAAQMRMLQARETIELPDVRPIDAAWPRVPRALQRAVWGYVARFEAGLDIAGAVQESSLTLRLGTGIPIEIKIVRPPTKRDDRLPES